jgi:hypothetical protein
LGKRPSFKRRNQIQGFPGFLSDQLLLFLVATRGAGAAFGWFGFALNTVATFDVFSRLQVTNYGLFYILFESTPNGSDHIDVWLFWIRAQTASPICFVATFTDESR